MDNLIRITVPEGGIRTQGSKVYTLLCIFPTLVPGPCMAAWTHTAKLPGRSLSPFATAPGLVWSSLKHSSPFLPTAQPQALQPKP